MHALTRIYSPKYTYHHGGATGHHTRILKASIQGHTELPQQTNGEFEIAFVGGADTVKLMQTHGFETYQITSGLNGRTSHMQYKRLKLKQSNASVAYFRLAEGDI